jgi:hypothetical protein
MQISAEIRSGEDKVEKSDGEGRRRKEEETDEGGAFIPPGVVREGRA